MAHPGRQWCEQPSSTTAAAGGAVRLAPPAVLGNESTASTMDRTKEFLSLVESFGGLGGGHHGRTGPSALAATAAATTATSGVHGQVYGGGRPVTLSASAFTRASAEVSRELQATAAKVQQLTKCAL